MGWVEVAQVELEQVEQQVLRVQVAHAQQALSPLSEVCGIQTNGGTSAPRVRLLATISLLVLALAVQVVAVVGLMPLVVLVVVGLVGLAVEVVSPSFQPRFSSIIGLSV